MFELDLKVQSLQELGEFADKLVETVCSLDLQTSRFLLCLDGGLGAGKTTLTAALAQRLSAPEDVVSSPTFSLHNIYPLRQDNFLHGYSFIHHYDFYRIRDEDELYETGIEETVAQPGFHIIEWSNRFPEVSSAADLFVELVVESAESRRLHLRSAKEDLINSLVRSNF